MYSCMRCTSSAHPPHRLGSSLALPAVLRTDRRRGHGVSMDVPTAGSPPAGGHVCIYIYIYICLSHCRCVLLLLRPADFFVCRALASERACQSPVVVVCACFLLASDVPSSAAAAFCRRRFFAPLSLLLQEPASTMLCRRVLTQRVLQPSTPRSSPLTWWFAIPGLPRRLSAVL